MSDNLRLFGIVIGAVVVGNIAYGYGCKLWERYGQDLKDLKKTGVDGIDAIQEAMDAA